ncbi:MAG TPA: hypothetical protein VG324_10335, partial [Blastocatellia bacterium]|nr:hypothetical protein [Blastocatellia bacterium]
ARLDGVLRRALREGGNNNVVDNYCYTRRALVVGIARWRVSLKSILAVSRQICSAMPSAFALLK